MSVSDGAEHRPTDSVNGPTASRAVVMDQPSTRKHRPHRHALPEYSEYRDTGCSLAPSCLACPFERCRYDVVAEGEIPLFGMAARGHRVGAQVMALHDEGRTVDEIAKAVQISRRNVFRYLRRGRDTLSA